MRGLTGDGGPATSAQLSGPAHMAVSADGTVYISDISNNSIRAIKPKQ